MPINTLNLTQGTFWRAVIERLDDISTLLGGGGGTNQEEYRVVVQQIAAGGSLTISGAISFDAVTLNGANFTVDGQTVDGSFVDGIGSDVPRGQILQDTVIVAGAEPVLVTYTIVV